MTSENHKFRVGNDTIKFLYESVCSSPTQLWLDLQDAGVLHSNSDMHVIATAISANVQAKAPNNDLYWLRTKSVPLNTTSSTYSLNNSWQSWGILPSGSPYIIQGKASQNGNWTTVGNIVVTAPELDVEKTTLTFDVQGPSTPVLWYNTCVYGQMVVKQNRLTTNIGPTDTSIDLNFSTGVSDSQEVALTCTPSSVHVGSSAAPTTNTYTFQMDRSTPPHTIYVTIPATIYMVTVSTIVTNKKTGNKDDPTFYIKRSRGQSGTGP